ncbi:MAG: hypothetical protein AVDCRST_MAG85-2718, partial [uncultured Solirubrobacteraceae bacterium]
MPAAATARHGPPRQPARPASREPLEHAPDAGQSLALPKTPGPPARQPAAQPGLPQPVPAAWSPVTLDRDKD